MTHFKRFLHGFCLLMFSRTLFAPDVKASWGGDLGSQGKEKVSQNKGGRGAEKQRRGGRGEKRLQLARNSSTHKRIHPNIHKHSLTHAHTQTLSLTHTHTPKYRHTDTHTHTHTHAHTHTHTGAHIWPEIAGPNCIADTQLTRTLIALCRPGKLNEDMLPL